MVDIPAIRARLEKAQLLTYAASPVPDCLKDLSTLLNELELANARIAVLEKEHAELIRLAGKVSD